MLNCPHHVQWVRRVPGGLHQCIQCFQVMTKKDIYPKYEDLTDDFRRRWDAHEATRPPPEPAAPPAPPAAATRPAAEKAAPAAAPASAPARDMTQPAAPPARPPMRPASGAAAPPPATPAGPSEH